MAPKLEFTLKGSSSDPDFRYLTWTPVPAQIRVVDSDGATEALEVTMRTEAGDGGRLAFRIDPAEDGAEELTLSVPATGEPVDLFLSGWFGAPSLTDADCVLELVVDNVVVSRTPFMVRIRKNAENLTDSERLAFTSALATLNNTGAGVFASFRAMHTEDSKLQAHGFDGFFPWHRAYLLDLERELQQVTPSVTLPYWQFDDPAPRLFTKEFLGAPDGTGAAVISDTNPLRSWTTDGQLGIRRTPDFDPVTSGAAVSAREPEVVGDTSPYLTFRDVYEGDPHGSAHVSFFGDISDIPTAAKDPLFFLLHCNVDRLWAKWQWWHDRHDPTQQDTYFFRGKAGPEPGTTEIGHNLLDTMWPWNNETGNGRPPTAPRHPFPGSASASGPPQKPIIRDMIDYQGHGGGASLGFDYDDVPYENRG